MSFVSRIFGQLTVLLKLIQEKKVVGGKNLKCDFVIFDKSQFSEIRWVMPHGSWLFFDPRYEEVLYLRPFLHGFIRWVNSGLSQSLTYHYFSCFVVMSSPKAIFSAAYFDENLYAVRNSNNGFLNFKFIVFQSSLWDSYSIPPVRGSLTQDDLVFCLSDSYQSLWREISGPVQTKPICTLGAQRFKSNLKNSGKTRKSGHLNKSSGAAWISVWRNPVTTSQILGADDKDSYELERACLRSITQTCLEIGIPFNILGGRKVNDSDDEEEFYTEILRDLPWSFVRPKIGETAYERVNNFHLLFGAGSTLLYESLFLGKKVLFVDTNRLAPRRHPMGFPNENPPLDLLIDPLSMDDMQRKVRFISSISNKDMRELSGQLLGAKTMRSSEAGIRSQIVKVICDE